MINWEERVSKMPWDPNLDFCFNDSPTLSSSLQKEGRCNFKTCRGFDTRCPGKMRLGLEIASWVPVFNPKLETRLYRAVSKTSSTHLKGLEGKPHVIPLRNGNPPNTFLGRSSYTAKKPLPRMLLLLRNSTQSRLSVETRGSGTLSPQNLPYSCCCC